jgi:mannosyltransferase OCH1-like enzyme
MRRGVVIFALCATAILLFLVNSVWTLLTLLVEDGHEDAISKAELPAPGKPQIDSRPQLIPKILHQTYINTSIPEVWQGAQQSCLDLHTAPDWEYKLWTDEASLQFIKDEYEWFYETFKNYPYPIQRADAIRYFVLNHFGGVYIDLDDGCNRELEPLLSYPAWVRKTMPTGISNDAMGAVPHHPFFMSVIEKLKDYDRNWILPYITVMGSTGPLFLSVMWRHWVSSGNNIDGGRVRIIFPEEYNGHSWSFFTHHLGNSWHAADVQLIFWVSMPAPLLEIRTRVSFLLTLLSFSDGSQLGPRHPLRLRPRWLRPLVLLVVLPPLHSHAPIRGRRHPSLEKRVDPLTAAVLAPCERAERVRARVEA